MRLTSVLRADRTLPQLLAVARESGYFGVQYSGAERELRLDGQRLGARLMENVQRRWRAAQVAEGRLSTKELGMGGSRGGGWMDANEAGLRRRLRVLGADERCAEMPFEMWEEFGSAGGVAGKVGDMRDIEQGLAVSGERCTGLAQMLFTSESQAECFMHVQRQRKIWWMKMFANPGRIFATEVRKNGHVHYTSLCSKFNFGHIEMERIECFADDPILSESYPTIIRSTVGLESATLGMVLDAADEAEENELVLHRTIAPFQCGVLCRSGPAKDEANLKDLTKYVQMLLTRSDISTYTDFEQALCADVDTEAERLAFMDRIGVPYVLLLNATSLEQGLMELRNRDTTLSETVHISDLPGYLVDIFGYD